ncbi:MAG: hypothetical protein M5R36_20500 [Deltaproteobacteria bacterium]|nr:hypothetical protein [Deltaproteobacteria bacterium]
MLRKEPAKKSSPAEQPRHAGAPAEQSEFLIPASRTEKELAAAETLDDVRVVLGECTRCKLHPSRTNIVLALKPAGGVDVYRRGPGPTKTPGLTLCRARGQL